MTGAVASIGVVERDEAREGRPASRPTLGGTAGASSRASRNGLVGAALDALDNRRLFVLLPFAVIVGLIGSLAGGSLPEPSLLGAGAVALALSSIPAARSLAASRVLALLAAAWAGLALLPVHGALFGTPMLSRPVYGVYQMRVDEVVSRNEDGLRLFVSAIAPTDGSRGVPMRRARLLVGGGGAVPAPGDLIGGPVRFYPVPGPALPGGFDTQFHAYFDGVGAYGATVGAIEVLRTGDTSTPARVVDDIRRAIGERIDGILQQPSAGIARALITGDQSAVSGGARETMADAGLAHVLSISGLHLTIVAGGVFVVLRALLAGFGSLARHVSVKRLAACGGIAAALLYYSISGGNVAALRATVMIVLVFGAVIVGRRALTMRNVAIAALFVLLMDPASVFRPSFQLSFAAVVALIGAWELARGGESSERSLAARFFAYFGGIAVTSLVAGAATLLFSMYHFQQTSPLGVLGNLISLPLVGFVMMPSAVFAALLMPVGLEVPFLLAMGWSIDRMLDLAALVSALSRGIDGSALLAPISLLLGLGALAWFAFLTSWHRLIGPALLVPAVALFGIDRPPDVLIADTTQAIALRLEDGLAIVAGRPESFVVEVWRDTYGEPMPAAEIACDSIACIATSPRGFTMALVKDPAGFYEECSADLVITRRHAPGACAAGAVIDAADLRDGGVHWLRWDAAAMTFEIRRAINAPAQPWRIAGGS